MGKEKDGFWCDVFLFPFVPMSAPQFISNVTACISGMEINKQVVIKKKKKKKVICKLLFSKVSSEVQTKDLSHFLHLIAVCTVEMIPLLLGKS